jgi:cytochrome P450
MSISKYQYKELQQAFQPGQQNFAENPYGVYALLRELDEPFYYAEMNAYLLSRYQDVDGVARDGRMVRSLEAFMPADYVAEQQHLANFHDMPNHERFVQFSMLERDGELHRRLRMVVLQEFTRSWVAQYQSVIKQTVERLLDALMAQQDIDFIGDFAAHIPGYVIGHVLGVADEDCPMLRTWSENIVQYFDADRSEARKQLAEQATTEFALYLKDLIAQRGRRPGKDLLTRLISARDAGKLNEDELISTSMLILAGGHGSTIDVLGNGMLALFNHPDQLAELRNNPALAPAAVQEMIRYDSPLPFFHRYASVDCEVMGISFPKGTKFGLLYGSANRDPKQFSHADRFDTNRNPNRHLGFGRGAHLCLGNNLARLNMEITFSSLLARVKTIELRQTPQFRLGLASRGVRELAVRLG